MRKRANLTLASATARQPQADVSQRNAHRRDSQIVSAFIAGRTAEKINLSELTAQVYGVLAALARGEAAAAPRKPTVRSPIRSRPTTSSASRTAST